MRIDNMSRDIESTFTNQKTKFTIEASAKAFQILSSNLYTDKPLAIIRELSCNAMDSHTEANQSKPFDIILPNGLNPSLEIRDYGTGMSPEKVEGLFSTFFGSDKNKSNDAIGGLGVGSKTPFSYTDTFTLHSYWNKTKYTWLCFIDELGQPNVQRVSADETDEHNGIHYIIPVKDTDFSTFRDRAVQALRYFPSKSYNTSLDIFPIKYILQNDFYGIRDSSDRPGIRIIMGPVAYKLDVNALPDNIKKGVSQVLENNYMDIFCNIGDIDIHVSREQLSYDKKSLSKIREVLLEINNQIQNNIQTEIDKANSYLEACVKGVEVANSYSYFHSKWLEAYKWRNNKQIRSILYIPKGIKAAYLTKNSITRGNALRITYSTYLHLTPANAMEAKAIYYNPEILNRNARLKKFIQDTNNNVLLFPTEKELDEWLISVGRTDSTKLESLPEPEKTAITKQRKKATVRTPIRFKKWTANDGYAAERWNDVSISIEEINSLENTATVLLHGTSTDPIKDKNDLRMRRILSSLSDEKFSLLGIHSSISNKVKHITLPTLQEFARAKIIEYIDTEERFNRAFNDICDIDFLNWIPKDTIKKWKHLDIIKIAKANRDFKYLRTNSPHIREAFGWKLISNANTKKVKQFEKQYPLLFQLRGPYSVNSMNDFMDITFRMIHGEP